MADDERAKVAGMLDMQARAKDIPLVALDRYSAWSAAKLEEGVSPALIANLDAQSIWMLPEEASAVGDEVFDELLADLEATIGDE